MILMEGTVAEWRKVFPNFPKVNTENHETLRVIRVQAKAEPNTSRLQVRAVTSHIRAYWLTTHKIDLKRHSHYAYA
jgi:hypothetical protein